MDTTASRMKLFEKASLTASPGGYRLLASRMDNYNIATTRITSYNVCYTKLLRLSRRRRRS